MTNKEKYKQAFSALQVPEEIKLEAKKMADTGRKQKIIRMAAAVAACVLVTGGSAMAYAADVGGIQRTIQLWVQGDQTQASFVYNADGSYDMEYLDSEGNANHQGGGGFTYDIFGRERPLTQDEIIDYLNQPTVIYEDDGSVWVYYYSQKYDITNKFDDNVCYIQISNGNKILYMTIKYQSGWSSSTNKYPSPSKLK